MDGLTLPDVDWRTRNGMAALLDALGANEGDSRFVGGAVRDALLGIDAKDVDIATRLKPPQVLERLKRQAIRAVPTGIAHGTITAVLKSGPVEVTTLRRDVATDGRRATVAFSDDWREDAARRDFTINALYADPSTGEIHDYFGGLADLAVRRVRFIGAPLERIAEDHLRILRFFRFHARFGLDRPDEEGLAACAARANDLMALSRERIADELLKLLAVADPRPTVALMIDRGIFTPVLPEIGIDGAARLGRVVAGESRAGIAADPVRRLAALLPDDPVLGEAVAARLKLSNQNRKRIAAALAGAPDALPVEAFAYRTGVAGAIDRLLLHDGDEAEIRRLAGWAPPRLPIGGGALVARGLAAGPAVARALQTVERQWVAEGFPPAERVQAIADEVAAMILAEAGT
ncbi:CCA tRNA nucleotidyltransferase [Sphingomonas sanxanigenens]|uniref:Polynucleotide adenylyltransferase n=1 Tax=Sphingomonas sanxanigenens DSM 19645 = NX02 TaxID=1123269 RepID=W0AJH9_9SPHN|nr:CCA tRNA nucleotidyltransferase [Sphingomonas sanxanigenens]AHE57296.1 hypothetical protein NX02_28585 [Sphingomonas sanxanigenens DSM 19645 = NX02]